MKPQNTIQFPSEWSPQSGVMLTWPHPDSDWQPFLDIVEPVFCDIAFHISQHENVLISCRDEAHRASIKHSLGKRDVTLERVKFYIADSNDAWARDHGPISITKNHQVVLLNFIFNGWGKKFKSDLDNAITSNLHTQGAFGDTSIESVKLVMEGGSLESDGCGTLLTTSRCLLSPHRNPSLDKAGLEQQLKEILGIQRMLWLEHGYLAGDDTDSHIDTLARFCAVDTICYVSCDDPGDEHYSALQAMASELAAFRQSNGEPYKLLALPMTNPIYNSDGMRLPASYANFLVINNAVLAPTYDDAHDEDALQCLRQCFPDREIIAINCRPLIEQFGSLHCVTMQLPEGVLN